MKLLELEMVNFRAFYHVRYTFTEGIWLVYGPNGSGKTTLLEAIAYLSIPRSFRGTRDEGLVRWDAEGFALKGNVDHEGDRHTIQIHYAPTQPVKKVIHMDNKRVSSFKDLMDAFVVLSFAPQDLSVLTERARRRRFVDRMIALFHPDYYPLLLAYYRTLKQRNALLRQGRFGSHEERAFRRMLIQQNQRIQDWRREIIALWEDRFYARYYQFFPTQRISWAYQPSSPTVEADKKARITTWGAHRDHYAIRIRNRDVQDVFSHAQLHLLLLAVFLAWVDLFRQKGKNPVLVVDDLLTLLSEDRLDMVFASMEGLQVFLSHHRSLSAYPLHRLPLINQVGVAG